MVFSQEDRVVIKFLRENKKYGAKRFLKEFPQKLWSLAGVSKLLKKIDQTGSIDRQKGSGRPRTARSNDKITLVEERVLSQEDRPQTHNSQREIAREIGISQKSVQRIIKQDLNLKYLMKRRSTLQTDATKVYSPPEKTADKIEEPTVVQEDVSKSVVQEKPVEIDENSLSITTSDAPSQQPVALKRKSAHGPKRIKKAKQKIKYDCDSSDPNNATWLPLEGQSGES